MKLFKNGQKQNVYPWLCLCTLLKEILLILCQCKTIFYQTEVVRKCICWVITSLGLAKIATRSFFNKNHIILCILVNHLHFILFIRFFVVDPLSPFKVSHSEFEFRQKYCINCRWNNYLLLFLLLLTGMTPDHSGVSMYMTYTP